uniref:CF0 subunit II n=1 Tax=Protohalopteris sp. TaxID=2843287 RepID=A0A8F0F723_9PHAE|nr:CF0 subunit II [Protohalopteris sp.]
MILNFNSILLIGTEKPGGLFDFDGTLPIIALQFVILMFLLNFILYTPLLDYIDGRNIYVDECLKAASFLLKNSKALNAEYEKKTSQARKAAKLDLVIYQKLSKEILEEKVKTSQASIDKFLNEMTNNFEQNKESILTSFENEIESLSGQIMSKILL